MSDLYLCPSDGTRLKVESASKTEIVLVYLNSKTNKKPLKVSKEQLEQMINRNILKPVIE